VRSALYDVVVLGAGPSGLTAAIYAARGKLKTLVVTGPMVGGQIALTYEVDNYPGFSEGVTGSDLANKFKAHAERFGAEFLDGEATQVDFDSKPNKIWVGDKLLESRSVVVATGMTSRKLGVSGEDRLMGRGVFVCATCDAVMYEDRKVVVVGGGDSALQEALGLAKFASEITIIHRRSELRACKCLSDRAAKDPKIKFLYDTSVVEIIGDKRVEQVRVKDLKTDEVKLLETDGVLLAIGWDPNTSIFRGQLEMDEVGYIKSEGVNSSKSGIFIAGDLIDRKYRQVVTSCGSGCAAALEAIGWLEEQPNH
jgi:thioredoxin reductase (NADPH)